MSERRQETDSGGGILLGWAKPTEAETTLLIVADPPEETADAVAALTELDGFPILHAPDRAIRDRYFDTLAGALAEARIALRLREVDSRPLLTIKGPPRDGGAGVPARDEQEEPWPERAWALLRLELDGILAVPAAPPASDPLKALEAVGFVLVHDRTTARRVREVLPRAGARGELAELAVDAVVFDLAGRAVRHHELELEAKAEGGVAAAAALTESLLERFAPGVRLGASESSGPAGRSRS